MRLRHAPPEARRGGSPASSADSYPATSRRRCTRGPTRRPATGTSIRSRSPGSSSAVASLAWTIYRDLRGKSEPPQREVVERRVRVEVRELDAGTAPEQRDRIIEVVVDELLSTDDDQPQPQLEH